MSPAIDQRPQLKYPPRPMTRKGEQLMCLSSEGRNHVDQVVQAECEFCAPQPQYPFLVNFFSRPFNQVEADI